MVVAAYGVSTPIADAQFLYPDESTSPMEQFACDSFNGIIAGDPGDTVRFKISIIDGDGREVPYPADSFLIATKPLTKISEHEIVVKPHFTSQIISICIKGIHKRFPYHKIYEPKFLHFYPPRIPDFIS